VKTKGDVFDAIFPPEEALAVKFKADLYDAILAVATRYTSRQLQIILHEPQPRVSELLNGKLGSKSIEKLLEYAQRLGIEYKGTFAQTRKEVPKHSLELATA
jgi:predicted XRE-type DNA-binding protein